MKTLICKAINEQTIITFNYNGGFRKVEAFCFGRGHTGKDLLRAFQIDGVSVSGNPFGWKLFDFNNITNLVLTLEKHIGNRPDYEPNDSKMNTIFCNV